MTNDSDAEKASEFKDTWPIAMSKPLRIAWNDPLGNQHIVKHLCESSYALDERNEALVAYKYSPDRIYELVFTKDSIIFTFRTNTNLNREPERLFHHILNGEIGAIESWAREFLAQRSEQLATPLAPEAQKYVG
jgi:hypothetical protein